MKKLIILLVVIIALPLMSANRQHTSSRYEYAVVDVDAPSAGYWTNAVNPKRESGSHVYFSIRGPGTMTVTLQFMHTPMDTTWVDYATYTAATRVKISESAAGVRWRAGVKDADWTSGYLTFGFDW